MYDYFTLSSNSTAEALRAICALTEEAYDNASEHGFHDTYDTLMGAIHVDHIPAMERTIRLAQLALITSEVGEAVSAIQHGDEEGFREEIADIVIRILDLCGMESIDLGDEIIQKMRANRKRPHMHGKVC